MTVDLDDHSEDDVLASLADLRRRDVSPARARRLRRRCHALLQAEPPAPRSTWPAFRRVAVPGLAAAWCVAYLAAIIRYTAAVFATR